MKRGVTFLPLLFMLAVLTLLAVFMCLPQNRSHVLAVDGVLDLRGEMQKKKPRRCTANGNSYTARY